MPLLNFPYLLISYNSHTLAYSKHINIWFKTINFFVLLRHQSLMELHKRDMYT